MVLTMEFCEGGHINDLAYFEQQNLDRHDVGFTVNKLSNENERIPCRSVERLDAFIARWYLFEVKLLRDFVGGSLSQWMIFLGYIHCDPHPGNVLVRRNEITHEQEIVLLDHGLYQVSWLPSVVATNIFCLFLQDTSRRIPCELLAAVVGTTQGRQRWDTAHLHTNEYRRVFRTFRLYSDITFMESGYQGHHKDRSWWVGGEWMIR